MKWQGLGAAIGTAIATLAGNVILMNWYYYRRIGLKGNPVKTGAGADTIQLEVLCFEADYSRSVELAESVREALENRRYEADGMRMRSCVLEDSEETWQDDAYVQRLVFNVKI